MGGIYWIASYPKSGNTWFRAFLKNYLVDGDQPVDINDISTGGIASSRWWLDETLGFDTADLYPEESEMLRPLVYKWDGAGNEISYNKIHDAYTYTADNEPLISRDGTAGAIYLIRNPLDVAVSYSFHNNCTVDEAISLMGNANHSLNGSRYRSSNQVCQKLSTWSDHVLSWVNSLDLNCCVIRYEDMISKPFETFSNSIRFLRLPENPNLIKKAIRFSNFSILKRQEREIHFKEKPPQTEFFFRSGKCGEWKNKLTPEQIQRVINDHGSVMRRFSY